MGGGGRGGHPARPQARPERRGSYRGRASGRVDASATPSDGRIRPSGRGRCPTPQAAGIRCRCVSAERFASASMRRTASLAHSLEPRRPRPLANVVTPVVSPIPASRRLVARTTRRLFRLSSLPRQRPGSAVSAAACYGRNGATAVGRCAIGSRSSRCASRRCRSGLPLVGAEVGAAALRARRAVAVG